jgi:hypothetical protein
VLGRTGTVRVNFLGLIYLIIGVVIAATHDYFKNFDTVKRVISAILAVLLWPLVLLGVDLHIN